MKNNHLMGRKALDKNSIIQDGVVCPCTPPWNPKVSMITGLSIVPILILALAILPAAGLLVLIIWLLAFVIFVYPLRYLICARCPYYGMDCSSKAGQLVTRMFKKQEGKSMVLGLWLDVVFFAFLFAYPLPYIRKVKGVLWTMAWCSAYLVAFLTTTRFGCSACPFTFCPIGKGGRAFWGLFEMQLRKNTERNSKPSAARSGQQ
jgi:hypothetical protein